MKRRTKYWCFGRFLSFRMDIVCYSEYAQKFIKVEREPIN